MSDYSGDCKITVLGRCGQDVECRYTGSGKAVANFSIAVKNRGKTQWHRVVAWNKSAEYAGQYIKSGDWVYAAGSLEYRDWETASGEKKTSAEIIAFTVVGITTASTGDKPTSTPEPNKPAEPMPVDDGFDDIPF